MKNCSLLFVCVLALIFSCQDLSEPVDKGSEDIQELLKDQNEFNLLEFDDSSGNEGFRINSTCGGFYEGDSSNINKYILYPLQEIDVSCAELNSVISVTFRALDVPNKFDIVTAGGTIVTQSTSTGGGWLGYANYPGQWGSSLSITATQTKTFVKTTAGPYYIRVHSITPPNTSYSPSTDYWSVTVSCSCPAPCDPEIEGDCPCDPAVEDCEGPCDDDCGKFYNEVPFTTINQFHTYPQYLIDLSCVPNQTVVNVKFDAYDVVNKFIIKKSSNGNDVANTSWIGYASYPGPWGTSISINGTKYLTFTKTEDLYYLEVLTQTPPNSYNYYPSTDRWGVQILCPN